VQETHALRTREDQVVARHRLELHGLLAPFTRLDVEPAAGDRSLPHRRAQPLGVGRVDAAQQRSQIVVTDDADESEPR
jgi:hypothetical protein